MACFNSYGLFVGVFVVYCFVNPTGIGTRCYPWISALAENELEKKADPAVSGRSMLDAVHDTEAFVAANDSMLLVVFRGTFELTDWTTNLRMFPRRVPMGWNIKEQGCDLHMVIYSSYVPQCFIDCPCRFGLSIIAGIIMLPSSSCWLLFLLLLLCTRMFRGYIPGVSYVPSCSHLKTVVRFEISVCDRCTHAILQAL